MDSQTALRPVLVRLLEGRVGSTLVMQLLATAPELALDRAYPLENSYLTYLTRLVGRISAPRTAEANMVDFLYGDAIRVGPLPFDPELVDRGELARECLRAVWEAFSGSVRRHTAGTPRLYAEKFWGDVTPVIDAGLDPIVIDLVRDPRDVVASVRAFNARTGRALFGRDAAEDDRHHLRRMVAGMNFRLREFATPLSVSHLVIRYEDMIAEPDRQVARLERELGASLDWGVVEAARPSIAHHLTSDSPQSSVGRWSEDLSAEDLAGIERVLGEPMARLGYAPSS